MKRYVIIKAALAVLLMTTSYAQEKLLFQNNLRGVQHIGIPVTDIDGAKRWYTDILGFSVVHEPNLPTKDGIIKVAFLKKADITVELYQLLGKDLDEVRARSHGHIDHFAIDVTDVNKALENAVATGEICFDEEGGKVIKSGGGGGNRPAAQTTDRHQRTDEPVRQEQKLDIQDIKAAKGTGAAGQKS